MTVINRFIPWVCFLIFNIIILNVIKHYYYVLDANPKWIIYNEKSTLPSTFFILLIIFYILPFFQISALGLFRCYSEKMSHNFEYFTIRSLVMLFQAICLSLIYFVPLAIMPNNAEYRIGIDTTATLGVLYLIWLIISSISSFEGSPIGIFWNAQEYIERLNDHHNYILIKEERIKTYLKNTQF
jgi:hypothetical protein